MFGSTLGVLKLTGLLFKMMEGPAAQYGWFLIMAIKNLQEYKDIGITYTLNLVSCSDCPAPPGAFS